MFGCEECSGVVTRKKAAEAPNWPVGGLGMSFLGAPKTDILGLMEELF